MEGRIFYVFMALIFLIVMVSFFVFNSFYSRLYDGDEIEDLVNFSEEENMNIIIDNSSQPENSSNVSFIPGIQGGGSSGGSSGGGGSGGSSGESASSPSSESYSICRNNACVSVVGEGVSTCSSDTDCYEVPSCMNGSVGVGWYVHDELVSQVDCPCEIECKSVNGFEGFFSTCTGLFIEEAVC